MNNMNINSAIADTLDIGNTDTEKLHPQIRIVPGTSAHLAYR